MGLISGLVSRIPKLESRSLKYGYSNARVRAMKGLLLKPAFLDEMIRVKTVEGMVELLQRSGYKADLAAASMNYGGSELIETASSKNFAATVRKLVKIAPKSDRAILKALLVRWDLLNLKAVLNARRLKKGFDEIRTALYDVGGLDEDDMKRILKAEDSELVRQIRKTELGRKVLPSGKLSQQALANIEGLMDTNVYFMLDKELSTGAKEAEAIRRILEKEIDAKNIMIIERLKKHGVQAAKIRSSLIKGGTMNEQMVGRLIDARDLNALISVARQKFRRLEFKGEKMTELEIAFEKAIAADKVHAFSGSVLSAGAIFSFLLLKEEEINNLRKIAKGKQFNMGESEVRSMLVY
ncbi:MAG TPA: V-type ATPase subunit [Candidatus Bilamarchaeum sp.]|nr:V-type ATPase subunit [Candidatus Bilamarchaeum sp.]